MNKFIARLSYDVVSRFEPKILGFIDPCIKNEGIPR